MDKLEKFVISKIVAYSLCEIESSQNGYQKLPFILFDVYQIEIILCIVILMMQGIDNSYGAFSEPFEINGQPGLVTIHPEMTPAYDGISPTDRYHIYGVHPNYGTFTLIVDEDENGQWFSEKKPSFVSKEFITWIGERIENYSK